METSEYLMQLQLLEQQAGHFEEQLEVINQQIEELNRLKKNLNDFQNSKESEVFSEFGKGIYFKSSIKSKELLVEVGAGVVVKKTPEEAKEIIVQQIKKLSEAREHLSEKLEIYQRTLASIVDEIE